MLADEMQCDFFETSAANNINVKESFLRLIEIVMQRRKLKHQQVGDGCDDQHHVVLGINGPENRRDTSSNNRLCCNS